MEDGATVKIYYQARLVKLDQALTSEELDAAFADIVEGEGEAEQQRLGSKWSQVEKLVAAPERIARVAGDIVDHFVERLSVLDGKGMVSA